MTRALRKTLGILLVAAIAACGEERGEAVSSDDDLTSLTARQRVLTFEGVVYVAPNTSEEKILETARRQTQTAFGPLLNVEVAVQSRELQSVDPRTLRRRPVTVVDSAGGGASAEMLEIRYTYRDNAVVPVAMARKTALSLAVLGQGHEPKTSGIVELCTKNDREAREDAAGGLLWYDFNPSKASCRRAIAEEQRRIDAETESLSDPRKMIPKSRVERVYLPVTMQLARAATASRATYPEYDRLFGGGADPEALTIVLLNGRLAHKRVEARKDDGYYEWMAALDVIFQEVPGFELVKIEPEANVVAVTAEGRRYEGLGFRDFIQWTVYGRGWPSGMPASSRDEIAKTVADTLDGKWVTFEKKIKVAVNDGREKDLTLRIETLFGSEEDPTPHKRAIKRGDVVIYNGHSYIGYGPLDPDNFRESSFPGSSYQVLFFDACVSYNYYENDYFKLKAGGSQNLDMITNGLESPVWLSGESEGRFVAKLIGGSMPSYQTLLETVKATDALRVVDGEIDNGFDPGRSRVRIVRE